MARMTEHETLLTTAMYRLGRLAPYHADAQVLLDEIVRLRAENAELRGGYSASSGQVWQMDSPPVYTAGAEQEEPEVVELRGDPGYLGSRTGG